MDFEYRAKTSMHIFSLKKVIAERHGAINGLTVCKDSFIEQNEMKEDHNTLAEYGIIGIPKTEEPRLEVTIFYDFKSSVNEPLILEA